MQRLDPIWYDDLPEPEPPVYAGVVWLFLIAACLCFWVLVAIYGIPAVVRMVMR